MSDKIYIGKSAIDLNFSPRYEPISRVRLVVSEDQEYTAGNDTGRTIEISCPWGTQDMANNLLSSIGGYSYQPLDVATAYEADPLWELGDGVTVNGLYSQIVGMPTMFGKKFTADVNAPEGEELDHEYPYQSKENRAIERKIAQSSASFRIDIDQIQSIVSGIAKPYVEGTRYSQHAIVYKDGKYYSCNVQTSSATWVTAEWTEQSSGALSSIIKQTMDSLTFSVSAGTNQSVVTLKANGIDVDSAVVRFSRIEADSIEAGATITSPNIYSGVYKSQNGNSVGLRITGTPDSGTLSLSPEWQSQSGQYVGTPFFEIIGADAGWLESAAYLCGNSFAHSDETMSQVNLLNIASVAHGDRGSDGDTDYFRIVMDNGKYWEFRGDGIYYCDTDGEELNWVVLGN